MTNKIICFVCNKRITKAQMDGRQWWHEPECNHGSPEWERDGCMCDLESHGHCIPAEGAVLVEKDDDDDESWTAKYLVAE